MKPIKTETLLKLVLVAIVISPILIAVFVSLPILDGLSASNDWIGFWGGYIGAILGGIITLYVLLETIRDNKEQQRRNERISFYNRLLEKTVKIDFFFFIVLEMARRRDFDGYMYAIMDYNSLLLEIQMMLEIEKEKHEGIDKVSKAFYDFVKVSDELVKSFEDKHNVMQQSKVDELFNKLSINRLNNEVKKFIGENSAY